MKVTSEIQLQDFQFWSGAKCHAQQLLPEQFERLELILEDLYPDGMDASNLNDLMWFDFDTVKEWLGIETEED